MYRIKLVLSAGWLLLFWCPELKGQFKELVFERIGRERGFLSTGVTQILQDSKGYIWIGSYDGLNKYDGYGFTKYTFDPMDPNSISQNLIYTIWEDHQGFIWVSTFEGLCKFDRLTEKFTRYKPDPKSKFSDPNILSINEDHTGMMWLGGASGQLGRFNKNTGTFFNENFDLGFRQRSMDTSLHDAIYCIFKDKSGMLWIGNNTGLHKLVVTSSETGELTDISFTHYAHEPGNPNSLSSNVVGSIVEDHEGLLWIATLDGLNSFNRETGIFRTYRHDPDNEFSISDNGMVNGPHTLDEDRDGNIWIATNKGLSKLNKERTLFKNYLHDEDRLIKNAVFIDRTGNVWTGGNNDLIYKAVLHQKAFDLKQQETNKANSLASNLVTALLEDTTGIIWIGTHGQGLDRWDKEKNEFIHYRHNPSDPASLRDNHIYGLLQDRQGTIWVCNGPVLSKINNQIGKFTHYNSNAANYKEFDALVILSITEDAEGLIWLGTGNGIKSFDKRTGTFRHYYHNKSDTSGISDYTAQAIFADSRNNIWVGYGSIGTDKLDKRTGIITHYKHDPFDTFSISSNIVNSFYEDSFGHLWLATSAGGLCRYNYADNTFTTFTIDHGLPDNEVFSVQEDRDHNFWLSTAYGLSRFDPVKGSFTNYDTKDGLASNIFAAGHRDRPSHAKGRDGILYFGSDNGIVFFDPSKIQASHLSAPIVITSFRLYDVPVKGAHESERIILRHSENYFSFEFALLGFYNEDKNQYAYRLAGVDKDWVYSGSRRYAGYTDIGPGKYTFRVKAKNSDGIWNEEGTSMVVIIQPPWWRSWWAYGIYVLLLIAGMLAVHRYQKRRVIRSEREKAQKKELAQAKEIEKAYHQLKETQAQLIQSEKMASLGQLTAGIAHEIQNPLNFMNNFSEINSELIAEMIERMDQGNPEEVKLLAGSISENEKKIHHHGQRADAIVKGMLQHSRTSSGQKEPTDINALADEYLRLSYHGLRAKDNEFNATMKTNYDGNLGSVPIIPQDIGRVLLNVFNNAFYSVHDKMKKLQAGQRYEPTISVSTAKLGNKTEIRIRDNGNGIPQGVLDKIFQPFFTTKPTGRGTGLGLSLSYDIIKAHSGEFKVESVEGEYAEFIIILPL